MESTSCTDDDLSQSSNHKPWAVLKYGGTSVSRPETWKTIAATLKSRVAEGFRPVAVCSAVAGTSSLLAEIADRVERDEDVTGSVERVERTQQELADELGLDARDLLADLFDELRRLVAGARLIRESSPRTRARLMALGELMSTRLGVAWLRRQGIDAIWVDAREYLRSLDEGPSPATANAPSHYLAARCQASPSPAVGRSLEAAGGDVIVTQGFIASDRSGDTVLLGRGGSDTSAAYFGALLDAARVEIWTDVPGMFTANPRLVPEARLLRRLSYDEAQMLASMGAKVLHPRCLGPVRKAGIPLHVRCTFNPHLEGTVIASPRPNGGPLVKAVTARADLTVISLKRPQQWQPVGYLAEVTAAFASHGLSIDLISTSASHITATIDPAANPHTSELIESLMRELDRSCEAHLVEGTASISLVGNQLRSSMHELGPILSPFEDSRVHLVVQAANDLMWTFVVDGHERDSLVEAVHARLFSKDLPDDTFGPSWSQLMQARHERTRSSYQPGTAQMALAG